MSNTWQARYDWPARQRSPAGGGATKNPGGMGPGGMGMYSCPWCSRFHFNANTGQCKHGRAYSPMPHDGVPARGGLDSRDTLPASLGC